MKRKSLLFLLLFALITPWAANAQTELTVCDGTANSQYIPFEGYNADASAGQQNQMIYPADELTAMSGMAITSMKFYIDASASNGSNTAANRLGTWTISLGETDETTLTGLDETTTLIPVYTGYLDCSTGTLTITFTNNYIYGGRNLLVQFFKAAGSNSGQWNRWYFLGVETESNTSYGSYNSTHLWQFLPKNTFTYITPPSCVQPTLAEAEYVEAEQASIQWTENGNATQWVLEYSTNDDFSDAITKNRSGIPALVINDLTPSTTYYVRVKSDCGGGDQSAWSNVINFTTLCNEQGIPYTYGFEEEAPFGCWTVISGNVSRYLGTPNTGDYRLDFRGTTSNMVALPQFNSATNTLRVEFWTRPESTGGNSGKFAVGYMTDLGDASSFVEVETYISTEMTTSYVKKTVDLADVPSNANIAMRQFDCTSNYYWYVDDVTVKPIPSCLAPTDLAADASTNSAELSWTANSGETAWTLYWKKTTDENYTEVANATNPYTLNGLNAATNYQYYVVANCSANDASEASEVFSFVTECEVFNAYSYTENFDGYIVASAYTPTSRTLPVCWNAINTCTHSSYRYYPTIYYYSGTNYAHSTPNSLRFYSYYYSSTDYDPQPQYAILPEMENLAGMQITLQARGLNANSTFKVGLMTDPNDANTFEEITNDANPSMTTSYQEFTFVIPADATGNHVAIMIEAANSTRTSNGVYIDDITIDNPPACPKPTDLTLVENSVTAHTAQLSWTSDAEAWEICLNGDEENPVAANANPFELTGLTESTTYTAKVRAVCDGIPSEWCNNTVSFSTPIACPAPSNLTVSGITGDQATLNWTGTSDSYDVMYKMATYADGLYEEFGTTVLPSGWERYNGLLTNGTATLTSNTGGWNFGTGNGVFDNHARVNIYGNCQRWLVTPAFTVLQDASTLSFDLALTSYYGSEVPAPATTGTDDKFIVLISTDNMSTWITLREWNNSGSEYVYNNIANTATGEEVEIDLSAYVGQSVRIAFYGESTESNADNNLHIDNVLCGIIHESEWQTAATGVTENTYTLTGLSPETDYEVKVLSNCEGETGHEATISFTTEAACMVPRELEVVSTTTTTAVLTWTSNATAWQIQVNEEDPIDVTENPYTLEGLNPSTAYTFKVRANCDGNYTEWSESRSFTTECDAVTTYPWEENFDSYSTTATSTSAPSTYPNDNLPICWQFLNRSETTGTYPQVFLSSYSAYAVSGNCLFFKSSKDTPLYAILPQFDEDIAGLWLNFTYRNEGSGASNGTLKVGYMTDPADANTFIEVLSCAQTTTMTAMENVPFTDAPAGSYIAFMYQGGTANNYYLSIDNVSVIVAPTCLKPTELAVDIITNNSATLSWTANTEETEWTVYYKKTTDENYTAVPEVTENPYTLDGLDASNYYDLYVVANCTADDASEPSEVIRFATNCELFTITDETPYTQDFENPVVTTTYGEVGIVPVCWDNYPASNVGGKILAAGAQYNFATTGQVLYFYGSGNGYAALPEFTNALNTLQISFKWAVESKAYGTLSLGYITDEDEDYNSFTVIQDYEASSATAAKTFEQVEPVDLSNLPANATRLVFRWYYSSQWGVNVDDVEVSLASDPSTVTQTIELTEGWNDISIYLEIADEDEAIAMLDQLKEALGENGLVITGDDGFTMYEDEEWFGDLDYVGVTNEQSYSILVGADCTVVLEGVLADPADHPITINPGWNMIGFPCSEEVDVETALSEFEAEDLDMLVNNDGFTMYEDEEWFGDIVTLVPGQGYLYYSNSNEVKTLVFQIGRYSVKANSGSHKGKASTGTQRTEKSRVVGLNDEQ